MRRPAHEGRSGNQIVQTLIADAIGKETPFASTRLENDPELAAILNGTDPQRTLAIRVESAQDEGDDVGAWITIHIGAPGILDGDDGRQLTIAIDERKQEPVQLHVIASDFPRLLETLGFAVRQAMRVGLIPTVATEVAT